MKNYRRLSGDGSVKVVLNPDAQSGFKTTSRREPLPYNSSTTQELRTRPFGCVAAQTGLKPYSSASRKPSTQNSDLRDLCVFALFLIGIDLTLLLETPLKRFKPFQETLETLALEINHLQEFPLKREKKFLETITREANPEMLPCPSDHWALSHSFDMSVLSLVIHPETPMKKTETSHSKVRQLPLLSTTYPHFLLRQRPFQQPRHVPYPVSLSTRIARQGLFHYQWAMTFLLHRMHAVLFRSVLFAFGLTGVISTYAEQVSWPQFRGANSRGVGESERLPIVWSQETNIAWHVSTPGRGWSSPIVWGGKVFLTTAVSEGEEEAPKKGLYFGGERGVSKNRHRWLAICLDRDSGKTIWTTELFASEPLTPIHVKNSYASETAVTDGEHVYALFGQIGLFCLDYDGKIIWSQKLEPHKTRNGWGTSASPVLEGETVYVVSDNDEKSALIAFDKTTGKEKWRVDRDEKTNYSTPFVWDNGRRKELVVPGAKLVRSYSLDGKLLWWLKGMSTLTIPTPFAADGLLYLCAGYVGDKEKPNKPVYAIRPGAEGDLTLPEGAHQSTAIAWMEENAAPYNPSALVFDGRFYVLWDFGFLNCRDAKTGRELYEKQRLKTDGSAGFTSSPWAYRGRIFCLSEDGDTYVVQAGDHYKLERVNALGEMCMATPAISGDRLFIRTISGLYCVKEL
jgi:outer membrane protein assembly factor BamB